MEDKNRLVDKVSKAGIGASNFLINRILDLSLIVIILVYVLRSAIIITPGGKSVGEILADGFMTSLFGFAIARILEVKGLNCGKSSPQYLATMKEYGEIIDTISPYIDHLDAFCKVKNESRLKDARTKILLGAGIKYETYADKDFDESKYSEEKRKIIRKADKVKVFELTSEELTSDEDFGQYGKNEFGRTPGKYLRRSSIRDVLTKLSVGVALAYYGITLVLNFSWASLIWYVVQITIFLFLGVLKFISANMYMGDERRNGIIRKITYLYEFRNRHEQGEMFAPEEQKNQKEIQENASETV